MNFFKKLQNIGIRNAIKVGISSAKQSKIFKIFFLVNWIFGKWVFKKPPKKDILIYDGKMADVLYLFFKKDDCEVMHVRYESLNMHIFFQTIFSKGILNIKNNYKFNYIKTVSPKVVITCIDNNAAFYKLKDIYDKTTYISVQLSTRDNKFINECNNYYSNTKGKKLKSDHIFVLGKKYMEIFSKIIDSKIHLLGSFKNNYF